MCKKNSSRWSAAKLLLVLPLVAVSLAATATTVYVAKQQDKGNENFVNEQVATLGTALESESPLDNPEKMPTFQGGDANTFSKWVNSNLNYPQEAKDKGIQGRVTLTFTVGTDGKVSAVKVVRGVDPLLDNEAIRVVEMSPAWTPGKMDGKNVSVTYTFPVIYKLNR